MNFILIVITIFAVSILFCSLYNIKLSIALYIAYGILVPYLQFKLSSITLSYNLLNIALLGILLYQFKVKRKLKLSFIPIKPFAFLYFSLLALTIFEWSMPWGEQLNNWRTYFMRSCLISFTLWNVYRLHSNTTLYVKRALTLSMLISGIYGLFLTQLGGFNPYTSFLSKYFGRQDAADIYATTVSRFSFSTAGKIQSTMIHPMTWALVLCFLIVIFIYLAFKESKQYWFIVALIGANLLVSGVRTAIAALLIGLAFFLLRYKKIKYSILYGAFAVLIAYLFVNVNSDLLNLFTSFIDISGTKSAIQGSSIQMRITQFNGAITEIQNCLLVGKGYGWNNYYQSVHGDHPILLAFESLIFVVLCNHGILGIAIWLTFGILLFHTNRKVLTDHTSILLADTFIVIFFAYSIGTGEYGYLEFFSIYYIFLLCSLREAAVQKKVNSPKEALATVLHSKIQRNKAI